MQSRFAHQQAEYDRHRYAVARAYLWQMRTGKTRMAVESAVALHEALEINGVLVVAPNGVHRQWAEEQVGRWGGPENHAFAWRFSNPGNAGEFGEFTSRLDNRELHWLCVNMEALLRPEVQKAIAMFKRAVGRAMLVVDESHHFARAGAKRTRVARGLGRQFEYRRILTGTLSENATRQVFTQFEVLERGALGHTTLGSFDREFTTFDEVHVGAGRRVMKPSGAKNVGELKRRMARYASVVLRSDCEDLPPLQLDRRIVEMTPRQQKWWTMVKEKELLEAERLGLDRVYAGGAALVKLQQVEGGFWRHPDGRVEDVCGGDNPKMLVLLDEVQQYDGSVICWFEYIHELEAAHTALTGLKIPCARYHGRVPDAERKNALAKFKKRETRVLLAQPRAGGEGRDMSAAGKIVWYSHTPDAVVRSQANERATAMGGRSVQVVDMVAPVGEYFLGLTERKMAVAEDVSRRGLRAVIDGLGR